MKKNKEVIHLVDKGSIWYQQIVLWSWKYFILLRGRLLIISGVVGKILGNQIVVRPVVAMEMFGSSYFCCKECTSQLGV